MTPENYQHIMCDKSMVKVQYAVRSVCNGGSIILFPQIPPLIIFLSQLLRNHRTQIYVYCRKIWNLYNTNR